ncbi:MAG: DNA mismatch repair protein MutS, partial [Bacteroidales bacterium]|nr:DNA mismatch repair protein MutS [Bacteroidales bacterium]
MATSPKSREDTPLMKQYAAAKSLNPDAVLLFRVGDFYETFGDDAIKASEILGITLTRRSNGAASSVELAGFPYHALDTYLPRLVRAGQRVAICEQLEDPKLTKDLVKRGITELITPGVALYDQVLEHKENNFLACVHLEKTRTGLALLDVSTGEFMIAEGTRDQTDHWLGTFSPKEILVERSKQNLFRETFGTRYYLSYLEDWAFVADTAYEKLLRHFGTTSLKGFGIESDHEGIVAAGAILQYLEITHHERISHISKIISLHENNYVGLDKFSISNLELLQSSGESGVPLISVIDQTKSPMGARLLKRWLVMPLCDPERIHQRSHIVEYLTGEEDVRNSLGEQISGIGDLERLSAKVATGKISPREMNQLRVSLNALRQIKQYCLAEASAPLAGIGNQVIPCESLAEQIQRMLIEEAPAMLGKGPVIARGVDSGLDELRDILYSGKDYLINLQKREIERTGISSLKVSFNNVFGYYIEVRNTHKDKVPEDWIRRQTLVSAERYITEELKEYESRILGAEDKILALEVKIYGELVASALQYLPQMQQSAHAVARLDVLLSFANTAIKRNYCKPVVCQGDVIDIKQGRHPVIEYQLPPENP